ncbi:hypothetical protein PHAVU_003G297266 [Phaseolus vulgaris]
MIDLLLTKPNWNDVVDEEDSIRSGLSLLSDLETVIWSAVGRAEARLWLCNTVAGFNCVTLLDQGDLFRASLRTRRTKRDLASQLLHFLFDTSPHKLGSVLARRSHVLENFFQGNCGQILVICCRNAVAVSWIGSSPEEITRAS